MSTVIRSFNEREFYLAEFRGRSIGIAWPGSEAVEIEPLSQVISELVANGSRVVVLSPEAAVLSAAEVEESISAEDERLAPQVWRSLLADGRAGIRMPSEDFEQACCRIALFLGLSKVVWIQSDPPLQREGGAGRVSVVDLAHLEPLLAGQDVGGDSASDGGRLSVAAGRTALLDAIRGMIEGGVPSVNVCAAADLERELFTYSGAGMFFTRDRYAEVRPLSIDDYDLANDLIERGEADGFLAPRNSVARDAVLVHGVGVFIEGRYLAGIGAILPHAAANAAELACLFALTRYIGEGAGGQIVRYAIERSRREGLEYLFSCTTSDRVVGFFERHGFRRVARDEVPDEKWTSYDPARRDRVMCLRIDLRDAIDL